jgi:hypothetical protein
MITQRIIPHEFLIAHFALIWPLPGMYAHVHLQIALLGEEFLADLALMSACRVCRVRFHVANQRFNTGE